MNKKAVPALRFSLFACDVAGRRGLNYRVLSTTTIGSDVLITFL